MTTTMMMMVVVEVMVVGGSKFRMYIFATFLPLLDIIWNEVSSGPYEASSVV